MNLDNIRLLKLTNSDNIVGEVLSEHTTTIVIKRPLKAMIIPRRGSEGFNLAMLRWDMLIDFDEPVSFNKFALVSISFLTEDIKEAYADAIKKYDKVMNQSQTDEDNKQLEEDLDKLISLMSMGSNKSIH